ncbi:MAG: UDP-N-acetylmuramoyl-L-alanyl-D-glutamate--2,6-diaminopimelate ligase [Eubacteriaceae bacterium]|jgi:UDP-N-acetylmuramoyl-L-alanyl-D-glutamate--2,6-diaminopimelate ligase|nr:UDP-N-acetylmuramoyl-L-alanyl-D-glutamate--2,6-diaminopimelate ligase [Eubacteriaceae bacterium]
MKLFQLLPEGSYEVAYGEDQEIRSLMINSKIPSERAVFFAAKGKSIDGADYIGEAKRNGAVAVVLERRRASYYIPGVTYLVANSIAGAQSEMAIRLYDANSPMPVKAAVTGTNGKTSFVMIASELFNRMGKRSAFTGTLGTNVPGFSGELTDNTTFPPALYAKILHECRKGGFHYIFSEASSQGIAMGRVRGFAFDYAVFMNLTEDHLDYHKSMEEYYQAKKSLFAQSKKGIVNISDPFGRRLFRELKDEGREVVSFASGSDADYVLDGVRRAGSATEFSLRSRAFSDRFCVPMIGAHNALNASLAIALAAEEGMPIGEAKTAASDLPPVRGRLERIETGRRSVYIDYAHTPDALEKSIAALREATDGALTIVFGCGGDREREKRPQMGRIAAEKCDLAVITTDNPRSENPNAILSEIVGGIGAASENYLVIPQRQKAIEYAIQATEGGSVLIAGKGHEEYMVVGSKKIPFSDRACARDAVSKLEFGKKRSLGPL